MPDHLDLSVRQRFRVNIDIIQEVFLITHPAPIYEKRVLVPHFIYNTRKVLVSQYSFTRNAPVKSENFYYKVSTVTVKTKKDLLICLTLEFILFNTIFFGVK